MPNFPLLPDAPIIEAIFDLKVKANPKFDIEAFNSLKEPLNERFPDVEEMHRGSYTFRLEPKQPVTHEVNDLGIQGYRFKSKSEKIIAQYRIDGFTLNKLKPYTSWEALLPLVMELWDLYIDTANPEAITRVAVRYINHITIPSKSINFDEYLTAAPQIPEELPQTLTDFFSRVTIVDKEEQIAAHVVQAFEGKIDSKDVLIIFDIDAFKFVELSPKETDIRNLFDKLRTFKNMIFFNYITEKTMRIFE